MSHFILISQVPDDSLFVVYMVADVGMLPTEMVSFVRGDGMYAWSFLISDPTIFNAIE